MRIMGSVSSSQLVQRSGQARDRLGKSFERLSSGKRINSGRDDAAGLAISSRMKARSVSVRRTGRNMQEGQEIARVADSGLSHVTGQLIRMRELAVQAGNDTNTLKDRALIQQEIDQIVEEIDRTALQTEIFGFRPLFDPLGEEIENPPSTVEVAFLVDDSGSMSQEIANLKTSIASFKSALEGTSDNIRFGLMVIGDGHDALDASDRVADIGGSEFDSELAALTAAAGGSMDIYTSILEATGASAIVGTAEPDAFTFGASGEKLLVVVSDANPLEGPVTAPPATQQEVADALTAAGIRTEVIDRPLWSAQFATIVSQTGGTFTDIGATGQGIATALNAIAFDLTQTDEKKLTDEPEIHSGINADEVIPMGLPADARATSIGVDKGNGSGDVTTKAKANQLIDDIDDALKTVLRYQGEAGGIINRLDAAQRVQEVAAEEMDRTVSQMEDADMGFESYELAKNRLRSEAADAALTKVFSYQRDLSQNLIGLVRGTFAAVG